MAAGEMVPATDAMRAHADQLRAAAREGQRAAYERQREADQLVHEAALRDAAQAAQAVLEAAESLTDGFLEDSDEAFLAMRAAEDTVRRAEKNARRCAQRAARAASGHFAPDQQVETAWKAQQAAGVIDNERTVLAAAQRARQQADAALDAQEARVNALHIAAANAQAAADNPGVAPRSSQLPMGVGRPEDMDPAEKQLLATAVLLMAGSARADPVPAAGVGLRDATKFRPVKDRISGQTFIIPPAVP